MKVAVLLFDNFETLDVFGPVEIFGRLTNDYQVSFYSLSGGLVENTHGVSILTKHLAEIENGVDIFLIPGGYGTRVEVNNVSLIDKIKKIAELSKYVLTVCTGTALLAKTGLLDGKRATSNKRAFDWVTTQGLNVNWVRRARWVVDAKYYTSSGVSAGMDMTLGFLQDIHGIDFAREVAHTIEFTWQENKDEDEFCDR
ncbi:DJ-1/PfpI family protein [Ferruginibacter paludis]|uniref:DJ-1/PfpI family protein n=1 Tax=Ferruginibacter paludis TaxID=1310417 RepID=UPI0025B3C6AA|nr:DJ-1/PfpI family protein [Ferruginibacter paludis]MDN3658598.1 DJ-1/PfpI family protein [Ferruginibacter paludis]